MGTVLVPRLIVADLERSTDYYTSMFGLTLDHLTEFSSPGLREASLVGEGGTVVLILMESEKEPVQPRPGFPLVLEIDDLAAVLSEVRSAEGKVLVEPLSWGELTLADIVDPDGYLIELVGGGKVPLTPGGETVRAAHPVPHIHEVWPAVASV